MDDVVTGTNKRIGDKVTGTVTRVGTEALLIHIGGKMEATQIVRNGRMQSLVLKSMPSLMTLLTKYDSPKDLQELQQPCLRQHEGGIPVEGVVRSKNSGGFEVVVGKTRTFCPLSQIHRLPGTDPELWVGQTLSFKVVETGDKIVVSRRALQEEQLVGAVQSFWQTAETGLVVDGVVTSVHDWGAYIDMDGVDGRIVT